MKDTEILARAKILIQDKKYSEARTILKKIPKNETAQAWLFRLSKYEEPGRDGQVQESAISYIGLFLIILLAFGAGVGVGIVGATARNGSAANPVQAIANAVSREECERNWWNDTADPLIAEFFDTSETAVNTSRGSLSPLVLRLQEINRDFKALDKPDCIGNEFELIVSGMEYAVDGYNDFLGGFDQVIADVSFNVATQKFYDANRQLSDKIIFIDRRSNNAAGIWGGKYPVTPVPSGN
jgi:hypothetical protein